jgi:hypothetical protein
VKNYYLPGEREARIEVFVARYNHPRYHGSIDNPTPVDAYFWRGLTIQERQVIKRKPSNTDHCFAKLTQPNIKPDAPDPPLDLAAPVSKSLTTVKQHPESAGI